MQPTETFIRTAGSSTTMPNNGNYLNIDMDGDGSTTVTIRDRETYNVLYRVTMPTVYAVNFGIQMVALNARENLQRQGL